jgi:nucleotide-binding universal stress UspA family protein
MKILVGIDGSLSSMNAAKYATRLAEQIDGESLITLISVHDDAALKHFNRYVPKGVIHDYLRELSEGDLKKSRKFLDKHDIRYNMVIEIGQPVAKILQVSQVEAFELIVLGVKGRSMINDLLLGSVALRVASASKIPVTLVK